MCTENQVKYIEKLCKWKGVSFDAEKVNMMEPDEASEYIDELKSTKSAKKIQSVRTEPKEPVKVNGVRLGLACKLVYQEVGYHEAVNHESKFVEKVEAVYELLNKAERDISLSHSTTRGD